MFNTNILNESFSDDQRLAVWNKGTIVPDNDPSQIRKDACGAWIAWKAYGDTTENGMGWEIDHIKPKSKGGTDELANLQPLQWQNNRSKWDNYPAENYCVCFAKIS